ncbi:hypothetical protein AMATHDRAFT_73200 [Amanita thiersii Skay4041]|uniref:RraA-like protein n=1 Tax=Amanita thiersii Skay4041 TaxID=703135 RepID=A0A2A9NYW7_9AGAR|nr:hypothetical protein AMATHDRAFT_73200 [Amanita thiersii Skay4041]
MSSSSLLGSFSTCEISDALIKLGSPHGGCLVDIYCMSPSPSQSQHKLEQEQDPLRICGPAYTVQMVPFTDTASPKLTTHFVDTILPGSVVVIDTPPQSPNAVWGGLMTAGAQSRYARGVVISGRCRDLAEQRAARFPVFARGHSTLGQSPFTRSAAVNVPLRIAPPPVGEESFPAVEVRPGDWIVADEDGVVCIPRELEHQVVELATKGRDVDARCVEDIRAGLGVQASFKKHRGK